MLCTHPSVLLPCVYNHGEAVYACRQWQGAEVSMADLGWLCLGIASLTEEEKAFLSRPHVCGYSSRLRHCEAKPVGLNVSVSGTWPQPVAVSHLWRIGKHLTLPCLSLKSETLHAGSNARLRRPSAPHRGGHRSGQCGVWSGIQRGHGGCRLV